MFRRRKVLSIGDRVRGFVWPRTGWWRASKYRMHRLGRLPGTPYTIAGGFACGAAISFMPLWGLHFILGAIWAWVIRANVISALIGTAVGNPWTFPFIGMWIYKVGIWMDVGGAGSAAESLDFEEVVHAVSHALWNFDFAYLIDTAAPVWIPMAVGGIPTTVVAWFVFYYPLKPVMAAYQHRRRRAVTRKETRT